MLRRSRAAASRFTRPATATAARLPSCSATCSLAAAAARWSRPSIRLPPARGLRLCPDPGGRRGNRDLAAEVWALAERRAGAEDLVAAAVWALAAARAVAVVWALAAV